MRIPVLAAVFFLILIVACDALIYADIRRYASAKHRRIYSVVDIIFTVLCWGLVVTTLCMPKKSADVSILPVMWMLFTSISIYISKFIYCLCSLIGRAFARKSFNRGIFVGIPLGLLVFIMLWWGVIFTRHDIETNSIEIVSDKLPASFDGLRVMQFSDAHVGTWGTDTTFISNLVDSINAQKPDLILFTGDIVNRQSSELKPFMGVLSRLKAPLGVYGVYGNHDYSSYMKWDTPEEKLADIAKLEAMLKSMGWKMLKNQCDFIVRGNDSIVLLGVENWGEPPFNRLGNLYKSYSKNPKDPNNLFDNKFKILMTHNPEHWNRVVKNVSNIDLSLAGHTHAMQSMLKVGDWKWSPSQYRYPLWGGLYKAESKDGTTMNLYVNIGAGEVGFPARIGAAKPELTMFTLRRKEK